MHNGESAPGSGFGWIYNGYMRAKAIETIKVSCGDSQGEVDPEQNAPSLGKVRV